MFHLKGTHPRDPPPLLWQVVGVYLAGSWVALQVAKQITTGLGLPDWVEPFAFVLLIAGLPILVNQGDPFRLGAKSASSAPSVSESGSV